MITIRKYVLEEKGVFELYQQAYAEMLNKQKKENEKVKCDAKDCEESGHPVKFRKVGHLHFCKKCFSEE